MTVSCSNTECPEHDVPKDVAESLEDAARAGEIRCGVCWEVCDPDPGS